MADKRINELPEVYSVYDETLLVAEQQGMAVKITAGQLREGSGVSGGGLSGGFVEMEESIPVSDRTANTLYGLILGTYS